MSRHHTLPRLFLSPELLEAPAPGTTCPMAADQARYLGTVLRRGEGDMVRLFNARDGEWLARIAAVRRDRGTFTLVERLRQPAEEPGCVLAFALLKRDATDLVMRMGTELGVSRFVPLITERTVGQRVNGDRLEAIAREAAEQCERLTVPEVAAPVRLPDFLGNWPAAQSLFMAVERLEGPDAQQEAFVGARAGDGILIGPEGGFSETELDAARGRLFVTPITLGDRVLRAETAVAAALALFDARVRNA